MTPATLTEIHYDNRDFLVRQDAEGWAWQVQGGPWHRVASEHNAFLAIGGYCALHRPRRVNNDDDADGA